MHSVAEAVVADLCSPHCHESVITPSRRAPILKVHLGVDLEMFSLCPADLPGFFMGDAPTLEMWLTRTL